MLNHQFSCNPFTALNARFAVMIGAPFLVTLCAIATACGVLAHPSDEPPLTRYEFRSTLMGTQFRIVLYTPDERAANVASEAAFRRIGELDDMLSDYQSDSELMRLCFKAGGPPVRVSNDLFYILNRSNEVSKQSDGAFDATVGPVVRLWRRARRQRKLPDPDRLAEAHELVDYERVRLDGASHTVQLMKQGMQLDLGGIAKGYAADEAMKVLKRNGVSRALVAAAGDIVVAAPPPGEDGWTIGISSPLGADKTPLDYLLLHDAAVSTSGDLEQFVELDGTRYSHIVDPKTGWALTDRIQATVVAGDGTTSDALATAVCVLGAERGMQLVETMRNVAALIVRATDTELTRLKSNRYDNLPKRAANASQPGDQK